MKPTPFRTLRRLIALPFSSPRDQLSTRESLPRYQVVLPYLESWFLRQRMNTANESLDSIHYLFSKHRLDGLTIWSSSHQYIAHLFSPKSKLLNIWLFRMAKRVIVPVYHPFLRSFPIDIIGPCLSRGEARISLGSRLYLKQKKKAFDEPFFFPPTPVQSLRAYHVYLDRDLGSNPADCPILFFYLPWYNYHLA